MKNYKLLTPGPLTTTETVKKEMLFDHCTWDDDYKQITQKIRKKLLELAHVSPEEYTAILMQGSGTFGVESVLSSVVGTEDKLLIVANGAYGERMADIAEHNGISYVIYHQAYDKIPDAAEIERILQEDSAITHVSMVHSETTSGILNDIEAVAKVVKGNGRTFIVDAMSSFGGVEIPVEDWGIDFIISSANKCIQGVPGFSFIIARKKLLLERANYLFKIAALIEENGDELAELDMMDAGKPILDCKFDIPACVDIFRFQAGAVDKIQGHTYPVQKGSFAYSIRE